MARLTRPEADVDLDPMAALGAAAVPVVIAVDRTSGGPSLRACRDAVLALPEVEAARRWAESDADRRADVLRGVASLTRRTYATGKGLVP